MAVYTYIIYHIWYYTRERESERKRDDISKYQTSQHAISVLGSVGHGRGIQNRIEFCWTHNSAGQYQWFLPGNSLYTYYVQFWVRYFFGLVHALPVKLRWRNQVFPCSKTERSWSEDLYPEHPRRYEELARKMFAGAFHSTECTFSRGSVVLQVFIPSSTSVKGCTFHDSPQVLMGTGS